MLNEIRDFLESEGHSVGKGVFHVICFKYKDRDYYERPLFVKSLMGILEGLRNEFHQATLQSTVEENNHLLESYKDDFFSLYLVGLFDSVDGYMTDFDQKHVVLTSSQIPGEDVLSE